MKFYDIPSAIPTLTFDGDKNDFRLHHDDYFNWSHDTKEDYEQKEEEIDNFKISNEHYMVYMWCDISGYEYWELEQEESNYIQISVAFKDEEISDEILGQLKLDVEKAINKAEELETH